jgi:hypothetical protein
MLVFTQKCEALNPVIGITLSIGSLILMRTNFSTAEKESQNNYFYNNSFFFRKKGKFTGSSIDFLLKNPYNIGLRNSGK